MIINVRQNITSVFYVAIYRNLHVVLCVLGSVSESVVFGYDRVFFYGNQEHQVQEENLQVNIWDLRLAFRYA